MRYGNERVEVAAAATPPKRPERPTVKLDWWEQQRVMHWHPYNENINGLLCAFGRLLQDIDPSQIDVHLARLYFLSTGGSETSVEEDQYFDWAPYKEIYHSSKGSIARWLYHAIHTQVTLFARLFEPQRTVHRDDHKWWKDEFLSTRTYMAASCHNADGCDTHIDLGFTMDLSEDTKGAFLDFLDAFGKKQFSLECPATVQNLTYRCENLKMALLYSASRHELNHFDEVYGAQLSKPRNPRSEVLPVALISSAFYSLLPDTKVPESDNEWLDYMRMVYTKDKLKLYGLIFEVLSGLRDVKSEGRLFADSRRGLFYWSEFEEDANFQDLVVKRSLNETSERWIAHLPSYRPEFIITLHDYSQFDYRRKRNEITEPANVSFGYLREACQCYAADKIVQIDNNN